MKSKLNALRMLCIPALYQYSKSRLDVLCHTFLHCSRLEIKAIVLYDDKAHPELPMCQSMHEIKIWLWDQSNDQQACILISDQTHITCKLTCDVSVVILYTTVIIFPSITLVLYHSPTLPPSQIATAANSKVISDTLFLLQSNTPITTC